MDDIIVTSNSASQVADLITAISQVFQLKDLGSLSYFLRIHISHTKYGISLTQSKNAFNVLHWFNMENSKIVKTPSCSSSHLVPHSSILFSDPTVYRSMVGALQYLTFTRPNLAFNVHKLCQFMSKPTSVHLEDAEHVLRYLRGTLNHGICFSLGPLSLTAFSDTD